jgi:hypothetical protein
VRQQYTTNVDPASIMQFDALRIFVFQIYIVADPHVSMNLNTAQSVQKRTDPRRTGEETRH